MSVLEGRRIDAAMAAEHGIVDATVRPPASPDHNIAGPALIGERVRVGTNRTPLTVLAPYGFDNDAPSPVRRVVYIRHIPRGRTELTNTT